MTAATSWPWKRTLSVASTAWVSPESVGIQARLCWREQLAGDDGDDALDRLGPRRVDRGDARVRERAAQELQVEHLREHDVVEVLPLAADEARVLEARDGVADAADDLVFGGGHG